jgi:phosphoribosylformylglycinamidine synthase
MGFVGAGNTIFLLGDTREELSGTEWAHVVHRHLGGTPPRVDLAAEQRLAGLVAEANRSGHLVTAHDLSDGGLAQALVESCLRRGFGAHITLPADTEPAVALFSESSARALVEVGTDQAEAFAALAAERGMTCTQLGTVRPQNAALAIENLFEIPLDELRAAYTGTLPALFA